MYRLFILAFLFLSSSTFAGWQKIAQLEQKATCCFFFDDMTGLAGSGEYNGSEVLKIWRTNDGGSTWLPCAVPAGTGQITSIHMETDMVGYASVFSTANHRHSLWKTTDGGYSWFDDTKGNIGYTTAVWVTSKALIKTKWAGPPAWTPGGSSTDDGNTFIGIFSSDVVENSNGIYFTSDSIGVVTAGPMLGVSWYTTNGGLNWTKGGEQAEAWSAWGLEGSNIFFAIAELQSELVWSTNGGRSWTTRFAFGSILQNNAITTGHISGKGSVMYVQTYGGGMLRTGDNDSGRTWRPVGGPSNIVDTRAFYVGGCAGELVIAFDLDGSVWKTMDGGDGTLGGDDPLALQHVAFPMITACSRSEHFGTILFGDCGEFIITSVTLENDPNGFFSLTPILLPDTLTAGGVDTFFVSFDPRGNPATYSARIRVKGQLHKLGKIIPIDSVIRITASASAVAPKLTASLNVVSFRELSVCESGQDTMIMLKNEGCDTLTITNGPTAAVLPFTIEALPLPLVLPPDSVLWFTISFNPTTGGSFNNSIRIQATSQGKQQEVEILLNGKARYGEGVLAISQPTLTFNPISICATDSLEGFITNTGCDTLIVDSTIFFGDLDYSVAATSLLNGTKLRPGDTIRFVIYLRPIQQGSRSGTFSVVLHNEHGSFSPLLGQFTISANVFGEAGAITQSLVAIDFGTTDLCTERDSVFTLSNSGCDTIDVTGAGIVGAGFELQGIDLPFQLGPGESKIIRVQTKIDTSGGQTESKAMITFVTNAANTVTPIQLRRNYLFPRSYGVRLSLDQKEAGAGGWIRLAIIGENGLGSAGSGIHTLEATLSMNTDLLQYLYAEGPNTVTRAGSKITITNPQGLESSATNNAIAELLFEVYLTEDSTTDIVLSDLRINGGDTSRCASQILGEGSLGAPAFTYSFLCGDRVIQKFIETGEPPLNIISIRPNPVQDVVLLEVASVSEIPSTVEVYTIFGAKVVSQPVVLASGTSRIKIDTSDLSEGQYFIRIISKGFAPSISFVKQ